MAKRRKLTEEHVHNYRTDQKVNVDMPLFEYGEIDPLNELLKEWILEIFYVDFHKLRNWGTCLLDPKGNRLFLVTCSNGRILSHNVLQKEPEPCAKRMCSHILSSFMMFVQQNDVQMKTGIRLNILISFYKSKNDSVLDLWGKDGLFLLSGMMHHQFSEILHFNSAGVRTRSSSELGLVRFVFGVYLPDSIYRMEMLLLSSALSFLFLLLSLKMFFFLLFSRQSPIVLSFLCLFLPPQTKWSFFLFLKRNIVNSKYWYEQCYISQIFLWTFWNIKKSWRNSTVANS